VLRKMLPPHNRPLAALAAEEGISEATLYQWRRDAREQGRLLPDGATGPAGWSAADKFAAVVESAALNAAECGEYCSKRGLYPEQIQAWRSACEQADDWAAERTRQSDAEHSELRRQVHALQRHLTHKEKALAETAAAQRRRNYLMRGLSLAPTPARARMRLLSRP
jgi:transposase-like protein